MKIFTIVINSHICDPLIKTVKADTINDALCQICQECIEEDNTGYFFELEDADLNYYEKQDNFYKIKVDGYEYGVVIEKLTVSE